MYNFVHATAAVAKRGEGNIIPDGAERLEAEVQQSAEQIQVNIHYIADTQLSVNFTFVCTIDQLLLSMHLVFIVIEGVTTEKEEYKCSSR